MTNSRGNINSYEHMHPETHSIKDPSSDYFKFSWDEMAQYDVPANLDYVLAHSNYDKAFYVGHSQGTTQFFAAADVIDGLENKIAGFVGLAPVMYIGNIVSPFIWILAYSGLETILGWLKEYNFFILPDYINPVFRAFTIHFRTFVWRVLGLVMGIDEKVNVDLSRMPVMANHEPGGTSYYNMLHWLQSLKSGEFQKLNLGNEEDIQLYNTTHIAETFSKFPSYIIAGENDALVAPKDFAKLKALLTPSGAQFTLLPDYAHADYIWGITCKELVFNPTIEFIKRHTDKASF
jgi:lysosomal acid lipase/cholesteryl ester hydrolase